MRTITAKFNSLGTCKHSIKKGDRIGWHPRTHRTVCTDCLQKQVDALDDDDADRYYYYAGTATAYNEGWL